MVPTILLDKLVFLVPIHFAEMGLYIIAPKRSRMTPTHVLHFQRQPSVFATAVRLWLRRVLK